MSNFAKKYTPKTDFSKRKCVAKKSEEALEIIAQKPIKRGKLRRLLGKISTSYLYLILTPIRDRIYSVGAKDPTYTIREEK